MSSAYGYWCAYRYYGPRLAIALGLKPGLKQAVKQCKALQRLLKHPVVLSEQDLLTMPIHVYSRDKGSAKDSKVVYRGTITRVAKNKWRYTKPDKPRLVTIIAGTRSCTEMRYLKRAIKQCPWEPSEVLNGCAPGADTLGETWAKKIGVPVKDYPANWRPKGVLDRAAGIKRNVEMAKNAQALIALWDGRSPGTKHMISEATKRGLEVFVYNIDYQLPERY